MSLRLINMMGQTYFFNGRVKIEKDTLSKGVTEKDTRTGFGIEFVGRIGTQPGKAQTTEDTEFGGVGSFVELLLKGGPKGKTNFRHSVY